MELEKAQKEIEQVKLEEEVTDIPCDKCGRMMVIKYGRYGKFLACPGYPECKNAKPIIETAPEPCPKCGGAIQIKKSKRGRKFYICENNSGDEKATCDYISWNLPSKDKEKSSNATEKGKKKSNAKTGNK